MNDQHTGWRWWQLTSDGHLSGLHTPYARQPWLAGTTITAVCNQASKTHGPHDAPWPNCECGIRLMPNLGDLLDGIRRHPARTGITPHVWRVIVSHAYYLDRKRYGVLHVPDVIGTIHAHGTIHDLCPWDDPPGTLRAQHAQVGDQLHLSAHLARLVPRVRRNYPHATVTVGKARGLRWLDEIAASHTPHEAP